MSNIAKRVFGDKTMVIEGSGRVVIYDSYSGSGTVFGVITKYTDEIYEIRNNNNECVGGLDLITRTIYYGQEELAILKQKLSGMVQANQGVPMNIAGGHMAVNVGGGNDPLIGGGAVKGAISINTAPTMPPPIIPHSTHIEQNIDSSVNKNKLPIPGKEFAPMPTTYTTVARKNMGDYFKWDITIKKGDTEMEIDEHKRVYDDLQVKSSDRIVVKVTDDVVDLNSKLTPTVAELYAKYNNCDISIMTAIKPVGYLKSIEAGTATANGDHILDVDGTYVINEYYNIAKQSRSFYELIELLNKKLDEDQKRFLKHPIAEMIKEELTTIDGVLMFDLNALDIFKNLDGDAGLRPFIDNIDDVNVRGKYMLALDRLHKRLTNTNAIKDFVILADYLNNPDQILTVGGICEKRILIAVMNSTISLEMKSLVDGSVDTDIYEIGSHVPNLKKLADGVFRDNLITTDGTGFSRSTISPIENLFLLTIGNKLYTVVNNGDNILIYGRAI